MDITKIHHIDVYPNFDPHIDIAFQSVLFTLLLCLFLYPREMSPHGGLKIINTYAWVTFIFN